MKKFILTKLTNFIINRMSRDMGIYFDEIKGNEEEVFHETYAILEHGTLAEKRMILQQII